MRRYPLLPRPWRRLDRRLRFVLTALAAMALAGFLWPPPAERPPIELVHGTCAARNWLLVADRQQDRIQAYDAGDGRPLGTLDRASGLADVDRLVLDGCWLVVLGQDEPQVVRLPELRAQPLRLALR
jgi:hypothetical protein